MSDYTPEPWQPCPPESVRFVELSNVDYRRAVACVHACKGIETERLEQMMKDQSEPLAKTLDAFRDDLIEKFNE